MRFRLAAFFGVSAACAVALAAACIPDLITDAPPLEAGNPTPRLGEYCGDGVITLGQYDGGFADLDAGEQCDPSDAGDIGCSSCRLTCEGEIDPVTDHCYFVASDPKTSLDDSEDECKSFGAHTVTFADDRERGFVISRFASKAMRGPTPVFWVGLSNTATAGAYLQVVSDEPGWSPSCSGCYAAPNVDGSIPHLLSDAGGNCVLDLFDAGWSAFPCTQIPVPIPVVCEREPRGTYALPCTGGTCLSIPTTAGKKRYLFSPNSVTADEAEAACGDLGGSLVVFDSVAERETLLRELLVPSPREAWIGYSSDAGTSFVWDGDGGMSTSPWGDNQPIADASPPVRAYVRLAYDPSCAPTCNPYDVQLAHDDTDVPRPYICQY